MSAFTTTQLVLKFRKLYTNIIFMGTDQMCKKTLFMRVEIKKKKQDKKTK